MSASLNSTHDAALTSSVESANFPENAFPIQNLPFGAFSVRARREPARIGVAIGDCILDISACRAAGLLGDAADAASSCEDATLNRLMALGPAQWSQLRHALSLLMRKDAPSASRIPSGALVPMSEAELHLPVSIGDYSDFFASIHHATNAGGMFRPDSPLLPNYKHVPIAYHGRASSIVVGGTAIHRPHGQTRAPDAARPSFGPSQRLDYELELGLFVGTGNALAEPIPLAHAEQHVFGMCIVNDWSARDIQAWEYQPLGPFLGKSFGTTISPWIVTLEALAPFRTASCPRSTEDPELLPYLSDEGDRRDGGIAIDVEVAISSARMRELRVPAHTLARTSSRYLYWTLFQMVAHHTVNGCNLRGGDLIATGTLSGPEPEELGSLLELTRNGTRAFRLPSGESRTYLQDGDEVIMRAQCRREGARSIGFGEARGIVLPAHAG